MLSIHKSNWACVKLTDRYMSEFPPPDKAIDALDEAGSRVHITNIEVPKKRF
jgi:ATP-dependent Clp protease ATP-binding subunit ClpC